ncbi:MAG: 1,4-alpha-glucan branching protein GlgB [Candidatus Omnitrophota bacterium]|nr:1,4-alpha-glucan branching protein GlgB [Candidatus Omnitrophota bacterium]
MEKSDMRSDIQKKKGKTPRKGRLLKEYAGGALTKKEIQRIVDFDEAEPFETLGPHLLSQEKCLVIRAFLPRADEAWIQFRGKTRIKRQMEKIHPGGFFQAVIEGQTEIADYKIGYLDEIGHVEEREDPFAFQTEITDYDLYLIGQGSHFKSFEKFGARVRTFKGVSGVHFAVWAPNAKSISVVGDFNFWRPGTHPMSRVHFSGVWGLFIPGLRPGMNYKFAIKSSVDNEIRLKADPYGFGSELRPQTASVVADLDSHKWRDGKWMTSRPKKDTLNSPVSIYEVHLGSWRRDEQTDWGFLNYKKLAHQLVDYAKGQGYTHLELLPIAEHPLDESWGYQVIGYYAPSSRFGSPEEFMYFVDYCHRNDIGVILDWVPGHFPRDAHGLADFDGEQIYAYANWKKGEHKEWGTFVFDYEKNEIRNFLISNALFWLEKYHIDGLRVDAVASMLYLDYARDEGQWEPNRFGGRENLEAVDFLKQFNETVHSRHPGVLTIAEESTSWPGVSHPTYLGGLGFSMKWNMGWMHDALEYFSKDPVYRKYHQGLLTFSLVYAFSENFVLPISHDEVVHGKRSLVEKMPGDEWQKFANTRLFFGYMFGHPGKKLNFMTDDIGQRREWSACASMDWDLLNYDLHKKLALFVKDLQRLYKKHPAFYELDFDSAGFEWIDFRDTDASVLSWIRWSRDRKELLLFTYNMTPTPRMRYRVGVPLQGYYQELVNSDAVEYGGSGVGNYGGFFSDTISAQGRPSSLCLNLPPLAANVFKFHKQAPQKRERKKPKEAHGQKE